MLTVTQDEISRLRAQHAVLNRVFDNRLIFPPMNHLRRVLDCGYGTASWAVDVAEQYPQCQVCQLLVTYSARRRRCAGDPFSTSQYRTF